MAVLIDWPTASQPDDVVRDIVNSLRHGQIVALPSDSGYVLAAAATSVEAVESISAPPENCLPLVVPFNQLMSGNSPRAVSPPWVESIERVIRRCEGAITAAIPCNLWSGLDPRIPDSIALRIPTRGEILVRQPIHSAWNAVFSILDFPIVFVEPPKPITTPEAMVACFADREGIILTAGELPLRSSTLVRADADRLEVIRPGAVPESEIVAAQARWILFVCTGNTCRSPMAEASMKVRFAQRLGCGTEELCRYGYRVFSGGVSAYPGDSATPEAIDAIRPWGGDLTLHRSQPLTALAVAEADHLIAMTRSHLMAVVSRYPIFGGTLRLLCGLEGDLEDPIGSGPEAYRDCAAVILRHIDRLVTEFSQV